MLLTDKQTHVHAVKTCNVFKHQSKKLYTHKFAISPSMWLTVQRSHSIKRPTTFTPIPYLHIAKLQCFVLLRGSYTIQWNGILDWKILDYLPDIFLIFTHVVVR